MERRFMLGLPDEAAYKLLTHFAANLTVIGVVVGFHFFCVPVCVLQIFFW